MKRRFETYICVNCGKKVKPLDNGTRDHCMFCLFGLHVDIEPGDRKNPCKGILRPVARREKGGITQIKYICTACGDTVYNKCAKDDNKNNISLLPSA